MLNVDEAWSNHFYRWAKKNKIRSRVAKFCASELVLLLVFGLGIFFLIAGWNQGGLAAWRTILFFEGSLFFRIVIPWAVTLLISFTIRRPRPFREEHYKPLIRMPIETPSFPSAHATIAFAFSTMFMGDAVLFLCAITLANIVALGRVAVGVHYFSDIIAGALVGLSVGMIVSGFSPLFIGG